MPDSSNQQTTPRQPKTGRNMAIIAWIIGMVVLTRFLGVWEENQLNPNRALSEQQASGAKKSVNLKRNRFGHYLFNGKINSQPATFILDTGATDVVIPQAIADEMGLQAYGRSMASTANGVITIYNTVLETVSIGPITLYNVSASINPAMGKNDYLLLGMSVLKQLEMRQQGNILTLTQN